MFNSNSPMEFRPTCPSQICGNTSLLQYFDTQSKLFLSGEPSESKILLQGPTRTGKNACAELYVASLACTERKDSLVPCGSCKRCSNPETRDSLGGFDTCGDEIRLHYVKIDCTRQPADVISIIKEYVCGLDDFFQLVWLDEVHRLELVGKNLEWFHFYLSEPNISWILTTSKSPSLTGLDHFTPFHTELPDRAELTDWTNERCKQFGVHIADPQAVDFLIEKSNFYPGVVLAVLEKAFRLGGLSSELIERYRFAVDVE